MLKRHQMLLTANHDFLVNEIPMDEMLKAISKKHILSWHDFEQLKTLRHQGRKALARYFLAVLPHRGPKAFQAFLESLQEANAQHLVELLLQQAGVMNLEDLFKTPDPDRPSETPSDSPLPPGPDPHEYAVRLVRNAKYIRRFVDPADISPVLTQNKVITSREADIVLHIHGRNRKWDLIMAALLQRGERAYQAFMAALLQKGYSSVFHAIQETSADLSGSDEDSNHKDGDSHADDIMVESDDEIKRETSKSFQQRSSLEDHLLNDIKSSFSRADDALLAPSNDLLTGNATNVSRNSLMRDDDRSNSKRAAMDQTINRNTQIGAKRTNITGNLNSVQEET